MTTTVMSIKTDKKIKEKAQKIAKSLGFPLGTLINAYLRQFINNKTVYFTVESSNNMSKTIQKELQQIDKDIEEGINLSPSFSNADQAIQHLKNPR